MVLLSNLSTFRARSRLDAISRAGTPMESTFRMGSSTIYLSQSETYRNAVAAQYAGTLDLPAFCTALTDGTICEESGLGCDFISFHTGATNEECRRKALAKGNSFEEAATHIQKADSNAGFAWEIDVVQSRRPVLVSISRCRGWFLCRV